RPVTVDGQVIPSTAITKPLSQAEVRFHASLLGVRLDSAGLDVRPLEKRSVALNSSTMWSVQPKKAGTCVSTLDIETEGSNMTLSVKNRSDLILHTTVTAVSRSLIPTTGLLLGALFAGLPAWIGVRDKSRLRKSRADAKKEKGADLAAR